MNIIGLSEVAINAVSLLFRKTLKVEGSILSENFKTRQRID